MSYLVNGKNIAPVAYGHCSNTGVGSGLYNCSTNGVTPTTVTLTTGTYTMLIPIAITSHPEVMVLTTSSDNTSSAVKFWTKGAYGQSTGATEFYFVIFGN